MFIIFCKPIFYMFCKPLRVYKALVIFISAVILYAIVFNEELSAGDVSSIDLDKTSNTTSGVDEIKDDDKKQKLDSGKVNTKYILFWTPNATPLNFFKKEGHKAFISNGCKHTNCFITHNRQYFSDQTKFDAIIFSIAALSNLQKQPSKRSSRQKFVAASIEPPEKYPVVNPLYDSYFNWTWTYKLDSDILWRYFRIIDSNGIEVGPRKDMKWSKVYAPQNSDYILDEIWNALGAKNKAVMWIKGCSHINQLKYIIDLERELSNFGLSLDTYSNCIIGYENCSFKQKCDNKIANNYYFYLAFENFFDEDYVTNTLLFAVQNFVVPVVMGKTNYSRFLPPGSYLDATNLNPSGLAAFIDEIIGNFSIYRKYFNWFKHYTYKSSLKSEICNLCTSLNNIQMVESYTVYESFRKMWSGEKSVLFFDFLFDAFKNDESLNTIARNGNYVEVRKMFKKKYFPETEVFINYFDINKLNLTTTEDTNFIPYELVTVNENKSNLI